METKQYALMRQFEDSFFWFVGIHELVLSFIMKLSSQGSKLKIFDAGCGTGGLLRRMHGAGEVSGMDFSEEALRFCRQRGLQNVVKGNLNDWIPPCGKYDVITCVDVLYHAGIARDGDVLAKFHEALKSGGILILNVPAFEVLRRRHDERVETRKRYRKEELLRLLRAADFQVKTLTYRLPFLFPVLMIRKILTFDRPGLSDEDIGPLPAVFNRTLLLMNRWENGRILRGGIFPFGSSLFAVVQKQ